MLESVWNSAQCYIAIYIQIHHLPLQCAISHHNTLHKYQYTLCCTSNSATAWRINKDKVRYQWELSFFERDLNLQVQSYSLNSLRSILVLLIIVVEVCPSPTWALTYIDSVFIRQATVGFLPRSLHERNKCWVKRPSKIAHLL